MADRLNGMGYHTTLPVDRPSLDRVPESECALRSSAPDM
jgi:hypothetical protein